MGLYERNVSESSDDIDIRPLEFGDLKRRLKESTIEGDNHKANIDENEQSHRFFSAVMGIKRKKIPQKTTPIIVSGTERSSLLRQAWKNAARKALIMSDPWGKFHLDKYGTEKAKRHRYHALKKRWVVDEVKVKMERESFNRGAMRECFRMKKLSNFDKKGDWSRAHNYVAKRYMCQDVKNATYFEDVRLQMDAKLWGEEFNRHNPPKKVDIFQMSILEMIERPDAPLFHLEHFIEGKYVKYNSNSGFVRSEALRMTPQAFSHFTFERSGHELIVVDIQGVGDLYTDPQIHTSSGLDYGDGNLGTRGMALFFHSHICNTICKSLGLTEFDLARSELVAIRKISALQRSCKTVVRGSEEHVALPSEELKENLHIRLRTLSSGYSSGEERQRYDSVCSIDSIDSMDDLRLSLCSENEDSILDSVQRPKSRSRIRYDSACDFGENSETKETDAMKFNELLRRKSRPSHVYSEDDHIRMLEELKEDIENEVKCEQLVLGRVHLDLAKYHELNRFVEEDEDYDRDAAFYHLEAAAKCKNLDAILALAQIHLGLSHDILPDFELPDEEKNSSQGFDYLLAAANFGDRSAIIRVATSFETGAGLPSNSSVDWTKAAYWYDCAVNKTTSDRGGNYDGSLDTPLYELMSRQAHMYWKGGHSLEKDANKAGELFTAAADLATEAMKGKLASKYYMLAEEAWAEFEE